METLLIIIILLAVFGVGLRIGCYIGRREEKVERILEEARLKKHIQILEAQINNEA